MNQRDVPLLDDFRKPPRIGEDRERVLAGHG